MRVSHSCFLNELLLSGKNNPSNTANTASTTANTAVNTAAGVEDLNIIQVTLLGVHNLISLCTPCIAVFTVFVSSDIFLQAGQLTETQVQSRKSNI